MKKHYLMSGFILALVVVLPSVSWADSSNTIQYSGKLIALPCTVNPGSESGYVYFGEKLTLKTSIQGNVVPIVTKSLNSI